MKLNPNPTIRLVLLIIFAAGSAGAAAQVLSKSEEARRAVGQCYSACMAGIGRGSLDAARPALVASPPGMGPIGGIFGPDFDDANDDDDDYDGDDGDDYDDEGWRGFVAFSNSALCGESQNQIRLMDGCNAGCMDVEAAYPATESEARKRFKHLFAEARKPLEAAGLWIDYDTSPAQGTPAFERACDSFMEGAE